MAELNWTDAQWQKVNDAVAEAFSKASVASAFLPMYGPLSGSAEIVRNERLIESSPKSPTIRLDADHDAVNLKLVNLTVNVELSNEQVNDETLSNALLAFRRAANILALEEDRVVLSGYGRGLEDEDSKYVANGGGLKPQKGLADLPVRLVFPTIDDQPREMIGAAVVPAVVESIGVLEERSNPGPFACVLGSRLFSYVHTPSDSLVLPADRITPQLKGGPLLRSGMMDANTGVVVSLAGNAIDIVVGTPPSAQFLHRKADAKYLFRVYQRFVLRIRDEAKQPFAGFRLKPDEQKFQAESERWKELTQHGVELSEAKARAVEKKLDSARTAFECPKFSASRSAWSGSMGQARKYDANSTEAAAEEASTARAAAAAKVLGIAGKAIEAVEAAANPQALSKVAGDVVEAWTALSTLRFKSSNLSRALQDVKDAGTAIENAKALEPDKVAAARYAVSRASESAESAAKSVAEHASTTASVDAMLATTPVLLAAVAMRSLAQATSRVLPDPAQAQGQAS